MGLCWWLLDVVLSMLLLRIFGWRVVMFLVWMFLWWCRLVVFLVLCGGVVSLLGLCRMMVRFRRFILVRVVSLGRMVLMCWRSGMFVRLLIRILVLRRGLLISVRLVVRCRPWMVICLLFLFMLFLILLTLVLIRMFLLFGLWCFFV